MVYNLEYTNFEINIAIIFHDLMNDKYLADVTIVKEDNIHLIAHKIILS